MLRRVLLLLFLPGLLALSLVYYAHRAMNEPLPIPPEGVHFELSPGTSFVAMTRQLADQGILRDPLLLRIYARALGIGTSIKAGEYRLQPGLSARGLVQQLEQGRVIRYYLTLIEGWTLEQAMDLIDGMPKLRRVLDRDKPLWPQLGIDDPLAEHPEGQFFPDTYDYQKGTADIDILRRAYQRMQRVLADEWQRRAVGLPYDSPYEVLIMASIVEKETGLPQEREMIAGVFVRRLQQNLRLQTDPTVIYGLGSAYQQNLKGSHLADEANRYNTYRHRGLPPTPIALPGLASIRAALHPANDGTLYFVARGDGSHYFSRTLEEHQEAVRRFQVTHRRKDYRSAPAQESQKSHSGKP